jgi:hypothetical protein
MDWMLGRLTVLGLGAAGVAVDTCDVGAIAFGRAAHEVLCRLCARLGWGGV